MRKEENAGRDAAVEEAFKRITKYSDKVEGFATKKEWITPEQKKDTLDKIEDL